ncbi:hypothetical protein [Actinacidiphila sp. ITFR-21]|uniref:hypothetical protein n=1 Tax=Actinacidiphila sp. ITFR-21 TaxID=3075199 RepID=UPI00288C3016|nr:hypothetical protein [Streptomyces sp. ITFR-21]WNI20122.1 hypothetical protein RLT57_31785 [Streptomyces sp. ITFR-21]
MSITLVRRPLPAVLAAAALAVCGLISGCSASDHAPGDGRPSSRAAGPRSSSAQLPDGISPMGAEHPVAAGAWALKVQGFERLPAGAAASQAPAGWSLYAARLTVTNQRSQIATAPRTELTARFGALGRQAKPEDATTRQPGDDEPVRVRPNGSVTTQIAFAFPAEAGGQRVTVTAETTPEGLAEPELLFFEGALPGRATVAASETPQAAGPLRTGSTPLGQWHAGSLRLSTVSVTGSGTMRTAELDLSVANRGADPMTGFGTTLRVFTGQDLHLAATIHPVYGYPDAAIAPHRTATQTVAFRIPQSAVGGLVTIEAVGTDGARVPFEGRLG